MNYGLVTICFNEQRLIKPFLSHLPAWIEETTVLVSTKPWNGAEEPQDATADIARDMDATVIENYWPTEQDQRNTGQYLHQDKDWVIILDPDEYLDNNNWENLRRHLETSDGDAVVVENQRVFWKDKEVSPCNDYRQLIAVRPHVLFVDKRVVGVPFQIASVELLHFSWSRTDEEVWSKISHYAHATDFDIKDWYRNVWLAGKTENLHPVTPSTLGGLIEAKLPPEIEKLGLL